MFELTVPDLYFKNQNYGMNRFCADCSELNLFS